MKDIGKVALLPRGDYNSATSYEILDVVTYNNSVYCAKKATTGNAPNASSEYWMFMCSGTTGKGIKTVAINAQSHLIITYTDDTVVDAGEISVVSPVDSVNGKTGTVVLTASDVGALPSSTVLFSGSYSDLTDQPTLGTAAAKDSTNIITSGSTNLVESGTVKTALDTKQDKETGKGLSTNDFTDSDEEKLDGLANIKSVGTGLALNTTTGELTATGIEVQVDNAASKTSLNPVQNKVITGAVIGSELLIKDTVGFTSKNLISYPYYEGISKTENGITFTVQPDGSIKADGTATDDAFYELHNKTQQDIFPGFENYILSGGIGDSQKFLYIQFRNNNDTEWVGGWTKDETGNGVTVQRNSDVKYTVKLCIRSGQVCNNIIFYPMLRKADILDDSYEPYHKAIPYYIEDRVVDSVGFVSKNLISYPYSDGMSMTTNGITFTSGENGIVNANGTATADAYYALYSYRKDIVLERGEYIISSGFTPASNSTHKIYFHERNADNTSWATAYNEYDNGGKFTFSGDRHYAIMIKVAGGQTVNNVKFYPMLRKADIIDDSYEPYHPPMTSYVDKRLRDALGVTGKNLLPYPHSTKNTPYLLNGLTFIENPDGSINVNGTANANTTYMIHQPDAYLPKGSYILSKGIPLNVIYLNVSAKQNGTWLRNICTLNTELTEKEFSLDYSDYNQIDVHLWIPSGTTINNITLYPMIRSADILDSTYEPYGNIQDYTDDAFIRILGNTGKNLIPYPYPSSSYTANGLTFTADFNGVVNINGTATAETPFALINHSSESEINFANIPLILSKGVSGVNGVNLWINAYDNSNTYVKTIAGTALTTKETEPFIVDFNGYTKVRIAMTIADGTSLNNLKLYPMLRPASIKSDEYEPYTKSIPATLREAEVIESKNLVTDNINGTSHIFTRGSGSAVEGRTFTYPVYGTFKTGEKYILSFDIANSANFETTTGIAMRLENWTSDSASSVGIITEDYYFGNTNGHYSHEYTITANSTGVVKIYAFIGQSETASTATLTIKNIMLRKASEPDQTYEPYYIPLKDSKFDRVEQKVLGAKNLIAYPFVSTTKTQNGITFTDNGDGSVTVNGTCTANSTASFNISQWRGFFSDSLPYPLILSGMPSGKGNSRFYIGFRVGKKSDGTFVAIYKDTGDGISVPQIENNEDGGIVITVESGDTAVTVNNVTVWPMLRMASDPDDTYAPYTMTNRELTEAIQNGGGTGTPAGFGTPTATIDNNTGTPGVTVTASGPDTAKIFNFAFTNLKGASGTAAGFGTPTATVDNNTGVPGVTVTASGADTAKVFSFAFTNLKGPKGDSGSVTWGEMTTAERNQLVDAVAAIVETDIGSADTMEF